MGFLRYYRKFQDLDQEEIQSEIDAQRADRRSRELEKIAALDLAQTSWPEPCHQDVIAAAVYQARRRLDRYPSRECAKLRELLSERHGVNDTQIAVGNGASELLQQVAVCLLGPGTSAVMPWPAPPLFALACRRAGARAIAAPDAGGRADVEALAAACTETTKVVFICNPNDPTGHYLPAEAIEELVGAVGDDVHVLVDEAYIDFADVEARDALLLCAAKCPRLLVFRSFSKIHGLAGMRCGYLVAAEGSGRLLDAVCPAYGVNALTQAAAERALSEQSEIEIARRRRTVIAAREYLFEGLASLPVDAPGTEANFLWLTASGLSGPRLASQLERQGILVRSGQHLGDTDHVRATVRNRQTADRLLAALEHIVL